MLISKRFEGGCIKCGIRCMKWKRHLKFIHYMLIWYKNVLARNTTVADALLDRLAKTSHRFELKGESMRK